MEVQCLRHIMGVGEIRLTLSLNWLFVPSNARTSVRPCLSDDDAGGACMLLAVKRQWRLSNANGDSGE